MRDPNDVITAELLDGIDAPPRAQRKRGRPRQHASQAERQRAYRQRLKARGMRVVSRIVPDTRDAQAPLKSEIIDLSECRRW